MTKGEINIGVDIGIKAAQDAREAMMRALDILDSPAQKVIAMIVAQEAMAVAHAEAMAQMPPMVQGVQAAIHAAVAGLRTGVGKRDFDGNYS